MIQIKSANYVVINLLSCERYLKVDLGHNEHDEDKGEGDKNNFVNFLNIHPIGDRCKAKSFFRKRFFGSFSSLKIE